MSASAAAPAIGRGSGSLDESLKQAATAKGRHFGAAVRMDQIDGDAGLRDALLHDCTRLTAEIHMKWDAIEWHRGRRSFAAADQLVAFAGRHGLKMRGHALLWDQSTPAWAKSDMAARRDWGLVGDHIAAVAPRFGDVVDEWDVVNEPIDVGSRSDGLRANVFLKAFGPDYIPRALDDANKAAPGALLAINDYGFDYDNPVEAQRRDQFLRLLERLKRSGAPLHAVGIQAHLDLAKGPLKASILRPFFQAIADLDLDIAITEMDVRERDYRAPLAERDSEVAAEAKDYLDIVLSQPRVKGVTTWGLSDRHSWLQEKVNNPGLRGENRGLPYDSALNRKPMYWAVREALSA